MPQCALCAYGSLPFWFGCCLTCQTRSSKSSLHIINWYLLTWTLSRCLKPFSGGPPVSCCLTLRNVSSYCDLFVSARPQSFFLGAFWFLFAKKDLITNLWLTAANYCPNIALELVVTLSTRHIEKDLIIYRKCLHQLSMYRFIGRLTVLTDIHLTHCHPGIVFVVTGMKDS